MSYPKTVKQFTDTMFSILDLNTGYWNEYPYNLGYYHSNGNFTFDCVNLLKAVLNGWTETKEIGYFQRDLSRTGDCDEWGLISQCQTSADFSKLTEVSVLYMSGHIGCYVGDYVKNGKTYNVIECTSNQWGNGVIPSYVDSAGRRLKYKGSSSQIGTWTLYGKMSKWLTYSTKDFDYQKAIRLAMKIEKGDYGNNPDRKEKITKKFGLNYYNASQGIINYLHNNY